MSMPNPIPIELRERAVRAYAAGEGSYAIVAKRFALNPWTLLRWVARWRGTGTLAPSKKGGGWVSPVDLEVLEALVGEACDATTEELTWEYNRRVGRAGRVHRSSILRALHRNGYVFKKNGRGRPNRIVRTSMPSGRPSASGSPR
jgi:transposase